jgi:hypothetical protein
MINRRKTITTETTSRETLHPQSGPHDSIQISDDAEKAIEIYSKLNAVQRKRFNDFWQATLNSSAVWQKDKKSLSKEELESTFEKLGFHESVLTKCADLFHEAVNEKGDSFRKKVEELLSNYCPSPFISDQKLDVIQALASKIEELESSIAAVESESAGIGQRNMRQPLRRSEACSTTQSKTING